MSYRFCDAAYPGDVGDGIAFDLAMTGWSTPPSENMVAQILVHGAEFWVHPAGEALGNSSAAQLGGTTVRLARNFDKCLR